MILTLIKNSKILINTNSNLNRTAGDTIMITNWMNIFMKNNNYIYLLSKNGTSEVFIKNLLYPNYEIITAKNNIEILNILEINHDYINYYFIRNHEILKYLKHKRYLFKTILYGLDIHLPFILELDARYMFVITQSLELKHKYLRNGIPKDKIHVLEPFGYDYDFDLPERNDNEIRLIYCGTLRDNENIIEIIDQFKRIQKENSNVTLKIVYGKIHGDKEFITKIDKIINENINGLTFKHNLSNRDSCYEIATSDIGIVWRKNGWGNDGQISTKMKEYQKYNLAICKNLNNTSFYYLNDILGQKIYSKNSFILRKKINYKYLFIKTYNSLQINDEMSIKIDNTILTESDILVNNNYIQLLLY